MSDVIIKPPSLAVLTDEDARLIDRDMELLAKKITARRVGNAQTYTRLINDENMLNDMIAYYNKLAFVADDKQLRMIVEIDGRHVPFTVHKNAIMQLAAKFSIVGKHVANLLKESDAWAISVLATTLNGYVQHKRSKDVGLIRAVGSEIRGILSDSYHRYSTGYVYDELLKTKAKDAYVMNAQYDGLVSYIELVSNKMTSFYADGKLVNMVFGMQIRNSSFGLAALDVRPFSFKVVCGNGMTTDSVYRSIHKGNTQSQYGYLSNETLLKEAELNKSYVMDAANFIFSDDQIASQVSAMSMLANEKVDPQSIQKLTNRGIQKQELDEVINIILGGSPEDGLLGNNSAYDVIQSISKVAQQKPLAREKELIEIAGDFVQLAITANK